MATGGGKYFVSLTMY